MPRQKHSIEMVKTTLQLDERLDLHEKGWVIQRVGWVIIFAIMLAGLLGLFGEGLFSQKTVSNGGTKVEYERFFRYETEMKIKFESGTHIRTISFPQEYLKDFRIVRFEPEPFSNNTSHNEVIYNFLPEQNLIVSIYLIPKSYGFISGTWKVNGTSNFNLNHFIYP
jgi:hypothetical protein